MTLMEYSGNFVCAGFCSVTVLGLLVFSFEVYGLVKHGTLWKILHL